MLNCGRYLRKICTASLRTVGGNPPPLNGNLDPVWLVRRGSFFVRHVYCGYGFVKLAVISCGIMGEKHIYLASKGHPLGYQNGKRLTCACVCACSYVFAGFGYVVCRVFAGITHLLQVGQVKIYCRVCGCARATPPPCHLLCKPDIFFVFFDYQYGLFANHWGSRGESGQKKTPLGEPAGWSLRTFRGDGGI